MRPRLFRAASVILGALFMLAGPFAGNAAAQVCNAGNAGAIGGIVFLDANGDLVRQAVEQGVNGVVLQVTGPSGSVQMVTSGGVSSIAGQYASGLLCDEGSYTVEIVSVPTGYVVAGPSVQSVTLTRDPSTGVLSKKGNLNFALALAPCTSSIGDYVWNDLNVNGVQDAGEPPMAGVTVNLRDLAGTVIGTTTTDANGLYNFVVPCSQTYVVETVTPAGFAPSPSLQGGDPTTDSNGSPTQVTIGADEHRRDVDFGFYALCQGEIGDFVWHDLNRNGVQDPGEPGLLGVQLLLQGTDVNGNAVSRSATTNASGLYLFSGVCPGTYQVSYVAATVPAGFLPTQTGQGSIETDSNAAPASVTLTDFNSSDLTIDFGFQVPCSGIVGDFVWEDRNANGVQDAGEPGIPNVEVRLYREGESSPAQVVMTNEHGFYQFTGLCGGNFVVEVNPNTLPAGSTWFESPANQDANDEADSDGIEYRASVSLPSDNAFDMTIDFGYFKKLALTAQKTAVGSYQRRITWTLTKTVNPTSHSGEAGQTAGSSTWSVTAGKSETVGNYSVTGQIVIANANAFDATFTVTDQLNDGTVALVTCPTNTVPGNGSVTCTYAASPADASATLNTASVTSPVGDAVATAPVSFTGSVIGDESVTLGDARFSYSQLIANATAPTFPETFVCPADSSLYTNGTYSFTVTNTATLTGANTNLSASADVTVACRRKRSSSGTATGYGFGYPNTSNWFMYSPYSTSKIDLVSGRDLQDAGDIFMSRTGSGSTARTTIRIVLHDGWSFAGVREVLEIQPFTRAPRTYLEPGAFLYKFTAPNLASDPGTTVVFSGNTVTVTMPGHSPLFYGIHADVLRELP